jgi:nucleotide-binding universal stress UspA family protein
MKKATNSSPLSVRYLIEMASLLARHESGRVLPLTVTPAHVPMDEPQLEVMLLHVCDRRASREQVREFESQLSQIVSQSGLQVKCRIQIIAADDVAAALLKASREFDLVVLRSMRRRTAGGLAVSDVTTEMIQNLACSVMLFGEPHS